MGILAKKDKDFRCGLARGDHRFVPDRHLPRLLAEGDWMNLWDSTEAVLSRLDAALRSERRKARAGHWSYDLNRHIGLLQALKAERLRRRAGAAR